MLHQRFLHRIVPIITEILKKYLPVLYQDPILDDILSKGVRFVARTATSLGNVLACSVLRDVKNKTWLSCKVSMFATVLDAVYANMLSKLKLPLHTVQIIPLISIV